MNIQPKLLDLFCGAGGAGMGYQRVGFDVVGVDHKTQKNYPFKFIQGDALEYLEKHGHEFDAIHASPPCQAHSVITPDKSKHPDLIPPTRTLLEGFDCPYVIENVGGARKALKNPFMLCGTYFGLKVYRHRYFESNVYIIHPNHQPHRDNTPHAGHGISDKGFISVTSGGNSLKSPKHRKGLEYIKTEGFVTVSGHISGIDYCKQAMGIDWMNAKELVQAIPPAYTEFIGRQLITIIQNRRGI